MTLWNQRTSKRLPFPRKIRYDAGIAVKALMSKSSRIPAAAACASGSGRDVEAGSLGEAFAVAARSDLTAREGKSALKL
jgi:hypothetical protein